MANRSRGRSGGLSKSWSNMTIADNVPLSTTQAVIGSVTIAEGSIIQATLLRSRGMLSVFGTPDAAADSTVVALGLTVVSANALAVGGTSVPGPIADQGADWLWHQYVPLDSISATSALLNNLGAYVRIEVDSKAMRRVPEDAAVALIGELNTAEFTSVEISGGIRFLFGS